MSTVTDGSVKYGFGYDIFNSLNKITVFDGDAETTLQEKEFTYNSGANRRSTVIEKVYDENGELTFRSLAETDKYDRPKIMTESGKSTTYRYQDEGNPYSSGDARGAGWAFNESPTAAKVTQINDPYDGQTYNYHYDKENRPCGYNTSGNSCKGLKQLFVQQISAEETKYAIGDAWAGEKYKTRVINDKTLLGPRVAQTKAYYDDSPDDAKDNDWKELMTFSPTYSYDSLGRLAGVSSAEKIVDETWWVVFGFIKYKTTTTNMSSIAYEKDENNISTGRVSKAGFSSGYYKETTDYTAYVAGSTNYSSDFSSLLMDYGYDARGNMTKETSSYLSYKDDRHNFSNTKDYEYDACNRLVREKNSALGIDRSYSYNTSKNGRMSGITDHKTLRTTALTYDGRGRLSQAVYSSGSRQYAYDNYGNRTSKKNYNGSSLSYTDEYAYTRKSRLSALRRGDNGTNASYEYNSQGIRFKKSVNGAETVYYTDGTKILAENRPDGRKLRYFYDITGICGFRHINGGETHDYNFGKDALGNIVMMTEGDDLIARYDYDAYGNCKVMNPNGTENESPTFMGNINPFRWKSYYRDTESGFYAVNTSGGTKYYEPESGLYLDAADIEGILMAAGILFGLDRNAIALYNILSVIPNLDNICTATDLATDPYYDADTNMTWWDKNQKWMIQVIILVAAVVLTFVTAGVAAFVGGASLAAAAAAGAHAVGAMIMFAAKAALTGALTGGVVGGLVAAVTGQNILIGVVNGVVQGYFSGFVSGCALYSIASTFNMIGSIVKAANSAKAIRAAKNLSPQEIADLQKWAKAYKKGFGKSGDHISKASLVKSTSGASYTGVNQGIELSGEAIHKDLLQLLRVGKYGYANCAEVQAINNALWAGEQLSNLYVHTISITTGVQWAACIDCTLSFNGVVGGLMSGMTFI